LLAKMTLATSLVDSSGHIVQLAWLLFTSLGRGRTG